MTAPRGSLYLVPNALDFGMPGAAQPLDDVIPLGVIRIAARLRHWVAENPKTTRAFLKRVDAIVPLGLSLQSIDIVEIPRPRKGGKVVASALDSAALLSPALQGDDMGLISEAGLPAVADPGATIVEAAHALRLKVIALPGASSLLLALAASGHNGQSFAFVGYLPMAASERAARIRELEAISRHAGQTQLMIETPYRNGALLAALLEHLHPSTRLSVSCGIASAGAFTRSDTIAEWRLRPLALPADAPAVFSVLSLR